MKFDIGTVLSASHGRLLTKIDNVYAILNFMLDENLFTHQLPRAGKFCEKFLFHQHPQLEEWNIYNEQVTTENWKQMLEEAKKMFGDELEIEKVPVGTWTQKDPIQEAEEMIGKDKVIVIKKS